MLGLIYLILATCLGYVIVRAVFPNLWNFCRSTYGGTSVSLAPVLLYLPASFLFGIIPMIWATYGLGCLFRKEAEPLYHANMIVMLLVTAIVGFGLYRLYKKKKLATKVIFSNLRLLEVALFLTATAFFFLLLFWSFFYRKADNSYYIGWSIASDFSPHIGMIRSFSMKNNFPTGYSHFAGEDIRYHFLFQFLVGNLEYLGMRLDWAFNLPSLICLVNVILLLYFYAVKLTGRRAVGVLSTFLFTFRSSRAFLDFAASIPKEEGLIRTLIKNTEFIGTTEHEDWGLWNLNVYCNQRHLAIGIGVLLFVLIYFTQYLFSGTKRCKERAEQEIYTFLSENPEESVLPGEYAEHSVKASLFSVQGWIPKSLLKPIAIGLLLGLSGFVNGACVIACLGVLFLMAIVSDHRLEYALVASISMLLTMLSTKLFVDGSVVSPKYFFGFLARQKTLFGAAEYMITLCGILPFVVIVSLVFMKKTERYLVFAFTAPIILAFTVSLTPDIAVNHKYVMIGVMLLCIPAASLLVKLFDMRGSYAKILSIFLVICMTITGLYEFTTILRRNDVKTNQAMALEVDSPLYQWVLNNSDSKDIFLTDWYSLNEIVFGGGMLYYGWPYYAWSAGYDVEVREPESEAMYTASTPQELDEMVQKNNIRFIVIDSDTIHGDKYIEVNKYNIANTYGLVYNDGQTWIFDTRIKIFEMGGAQ